MCCKGILAKHRLVSNGLSFDDFSNEDHPYHPSIMIRDFPKHIVLDFAQIPP